MRRNWKNFQRLLIGITVANMRDFVLIDDKAREFPLYKFQENKYLFLIFYRGIWCSHCKKQLQDIEKNITEFEKLNIKCLAVSCDSVLNSNLLKTFLKLSFPVISDVKFEMIDFFNFRTKYKEKEVAKPAVLLFSPDHNLIYQYIGQEFDDRLSANQILENVKPLLNMID